MTREDIMRAKNELDVVVRRCPKSDIDNRSAVCAKSIIDDILSIYLDGDDGEFSEQDVGEVLTMVKFALEGRIICPIEDAEDEFEDISLGAGVLFNSRRYSGLFKTIRQDTKKPAYLDIDRFKFINIFDDGDLPDEFALTYFASGIMHEQYPIKMPYLPTYIPVKTYVEWFPAGEEESIWYLGIIQHVAFGKPYASSSKDLVKVNRYFTVNTKHPKWLWSEIDFSHYAFAHEKATNMKGDLK